MTRCVAVDILRGYLEREVNRGGGLLGEKDLHLQSKPTDHPAMMEGKDLVRTYPMVPVINNHDQHLPR